MAVVWPSKNNFVNGDVLTAANMNNIADTLNVFNPTSATNGQVWVANGAASGSFQTPSGGFTLIQSISLTSGTRHTISSIPGSYQQLFFRVLNCTVSGGPAGLGMEVNGASSAYRFGSRYIFGTSIGTNNYEAGSVMNSSYPNFLLSPTMTVGSTVLQQFQGYIYSYASASTNYKTLYCLSTGLQASTPTYGVSESIGFHTGTTGAITSVALYPNGATFTGGTFELYGVK